MDTGVGGKVPGKIPYPGELRSLTLYHFWYMLKPWDEMNKNPEMPVRFYRTEAGGSPVLDWLRGLDKDDRHAIGLDLMRVQFGWPIGRPLVRSLKDVFGKCARRFRANG
jgi:hypothetical protein